jgi:hypothetical protein
MRPPFFFALVLTLALVGCTSGGGAKWYAPATWFSAREAKANDRAETKRDEKREEVLKAAQLEVAKTKEALSFAPESREVELAQRFNGNADVLLGQSIGSIQVADLVIIRKLVADLRSENATLRAEGEARQKASETQNGKLSAALGEAERKLRATELNLRAAFDRENALANELRSQRALLWIAGGIAVLCAIGWAYLKFAVGGLPNALGMARKLMEKEAPELAKQVAPFYTRFMNRHEQALVSRFSK